MMGTPNYPNNTAYFNLNKDAPVVSFYKYVYYVIISPDYLDNASQPCCNKSHYFDTTRPKCFIQNVFKVFEFEAHLKTPRSSAPYIALNRCSM